MDELIAIGEFSAMCQLSVKMLRHYHDVGLLEPLSPKRTPNDRNAGLNSRHRLAASIPRPQLVRTAQYRTVLDRAGHDVSREVPRRYAK